MDFKKLREPFPPELISWRVGATNRKSKEKNPSLVLKGIALAYIDARDVMARLDSVCGPENWQNSHPHANGKTSCRIGIKINNEWIWKENGAGDSAMDAEKGAFSDSFKRAAVLWGIGQYLYDVANIWVELDDFGNIKNPDDPRLKKALEAAAKGIRGISEPEPKAPEKPDFKKPFTQEEVDYLKLKLSHAETKEQVDDVEKLLKSAKPRMTDIQIEDMRKALSSKRVDLA